MELDKEGFPEVLDRNPGRVETLEHYLGSLQILEVNSQSSSNFTESFVEISPLIHIADKCHCGGSDIRVRCRQIELVQKVLLKSFRGDNGVVEMLPALFVIPGGTVSSTFHDGEFPEVIVRLLEEGIGICCLAVQFVEGNAGKFVLEDGIGLEELL